MHVEPIGNLRDARRLMRGFEEAVGVVSDPAWAMHGQARRLVHGGRLVGGYVLAPSRMLEDSGVVPEGVILTDRRASELMALWVAAEVPEWGRLVLLRAIAEDVRKRKSQVVFGVAMTEKSVQLLSELLPDQLYEGPGAQPELLPWLHVRRGFAPSPLKLRLRGWVARLRRRVVGRPKALVDTGAPGGAPRVSPR
ncbi:MAG: hypothetical protein AB8H79_25665 [Myxococcota bacterium]